MRWLDLHTVYRWLAPCGGGAWLAATCGAGRSVALLGSLGVARVKRLKTDLA